MKSLGQKDVSIDTLRSEVLLKFPNFNGDTMYNTQFVPIRGFIDTISIKYPWERLYNQTMNIDARRWSKDKGRLFDVKKDLVLT